MNFKNSLEPHMGSRSFPKKRRPRVLATTYQTGAKVRNTRKARNNMQQDNQAMKVKMSKQITKNKNIKIMEQKFIPHILIAQCNQQLWGSSRKESSYKIVVSVKNKFPGYLGTNWTQKNKFPGYLSNKSKSNSKSLDTITHQLKGTEQEY